LYIFILTRAESRAINYFLIILRQICKYICRNNDCLKNAISSSSHQKKTIVRWKENQRASEREKRAKTIYTEDNNKKEEIASE